MVSAVLRHSIASSYGFGISAKILFRSHTNAMAFISFQIPAFEFPTPSLSLCVRLFSGNSQPAQEGSIPSAAVRPIFVWVSPHTDGMDALFPLQLCPICLHSWVDPPLSQKNAFGVPSNQWFFLQILPIKRYRRVFPGAPQMVSISASPNLSEKMLKIKKPGTWHTSWQNEIWLAWDSGFLLLLLLYKYVHFNWYFLK